MLPSTAGQVEWCRITECASVLLTNLQKLLKRNKNNLWVTVVCAAALPPFYPLPTNLHGSSSSSSTSSTVLPCHLCWALCESRPEPGWQFPHDTKAHRSAACVLLPLTTITTFNWGISIYLNCSCYYYTMVCTVRSCSLFYIFVFLLCTFCISPVAKASCSFQIKVLLQVVFTYHFLSCLSLIQLGHHHSHCGGWEVPPRITPPWDVLALY